MVDFGFTQWESGGGGGVGGGGGLARRENDKAWMVEHE